MVWKLFGKIIKAMGMSILLLFAVLIIVMFLSLLFDDLSSRKTTFMQEVVQIPITWSSWIAEFLFPSVYKKIRPTVYLIVYGFITNFIFYSIIGHFLLQFIEKVRNQKDLAYANPPQPPNFN